MNPLLKPLKDLVRVIRNFEVGDYSPIMDELFDAEEAIEIAETGNAFGGWTLISNELPKEYGTYLVIRGHWYMGVISYKIATTDFHPNKWQHGGHWFDRGFIYTHWVGPITKPEMLLADFPILLKEAPVDAI
jgi:hypothetical protein